MIINLFIITFAIVYIIDHSGFLIDFSKAIYKVLNPGKEYHYQIIKPFGCSLCSSFWVTLIYSLIMGQSLIYSLGLAVVFGGFVSVIINKIIKLFFNIINKI